MSQIVSCPSCHNPLRVPADLLGRSVRCPACQMVFEAAAPTAPPTPAIPALSLDDDPSPTPAAPRNIWGAVEIGGSGGKAPPAPPPPPPPARVPIPEPIPERPRPRRRDDGDSIYCRECGKCLPSGTPRCHRCGTRTEADDRPRARRPPRDVEEEPHRGGVVLTLGILSIFLSLIAPIGLTMGIIAWVMGQGDLTKMRRREMDRAGQGTTTGGLVCGVIGVLLSLVFGLSAFIYFLAWIEENETHQRNFQPSRNRQWNGF